MRRSPALNTDWHRSRLFTDWMTWTVNSQALCMLRSTLTWPLGSLMSESLIPPNKVMTALRSMRGSSAVILSIANVMTF